MMQKKKENAVWAFCYGSKSRVIRRKGLALIMSLVILAGMMTGFRYRPAAADADSAVQLATYSYAGKGPTKDNIRKIFDSDSYWKMTLYSYNYGNAVLAEYYMELVNDCAFANIISAEGDDLRHDKYTWSYDDAKATLTINMLDDGYANHCFKLVNGTFLCDGTYYRTELERTTTAKQDFEKAMAAFKSTYGSYNPVKRLTNSNSHFRYVDITDWDTMPYDSFRNLVNNKSHGLVRQADDSNAQSVKRELTGKLGIKGAKAVNVDEVLFNVNLPETENGQFTATSKADVINVVFEDWQKASDAIPYFYSCASELLTGSAKYSNMTANDLFEASFAWNDVHAVAVFRMDSSIVIFRGPTDKIKFMTEYLSLGDWLWEY